MVKVFKPKLLSVAPTRPESPHIICETHLGETFNRSIMATVRTAPGTYLDFLFDANGEPVMLHTGLAKRIAQYFNKSFSHFETFHKNTNP